MVRHASLLTLSALALAPLHSAGAQVRFERTGYRLTSIGERLAVTGRVVDARRRPVANANIRWRIADPSIASVTAQGVVVSRRVGYTKLWAVAGQDSASALILVDQWAASFDFSPSVVRFDAVGAKVPLKVQVHDAAGFPINEQNRKNTSCRSLNERVATLAQNGDVQSHANGVTYVRCTDRGIADSVRVEVRQRALRAAIADKLTFGAKMVGDTFRIRIAAFDRAGDEIKDVQATWASLSPTVVSVDPLTGLARSVGPGPAKIVGQVGDVTDTLNLQVALSPGMALPPVAAGGDSAAVGIAGAEARGPALQMQPLYLAEGDEATVNVTARDALGATVANPDVRLRSSDTSIVAVLPGRKVVARNTGEAYVFGEFGAIRDSMRVSVRAKAAAGASTALDASTIAFVRPKFDTAAARALYKARLDSAQKAIKEASRVAEYSGRILAISGIAGQALHSTRGTVVEERSGLIYGGVAEIAPHRMLKATVQFGTGDLSTSSAVGEVLTVVEAEADLTFSPSRYFGLRGGYVIRANTTELATQRWTFPRASIVTKLPFVGDAVAAVMGASLLPGATYTGYADSTGKQIKPDPLSLAGEAGLEVHAGVLSAAVMYYVERFTFPELNGEKRKDQFSTIRIRLGLQRGRDR